MEHTYLKTITSLKFFLHENFYNDQIINEISNFIPTKFETFNIIYSPETSSFKIKIKKTNMKKNDSSYEHSSLYYYELINLIFCTVFINHYQELNLLLERNKEKYNLESSDLSILLNTNTVFGIYNMTTLMDNVIVITI
ncbi:MAG: hypothetical protein ACRDD7_01235 [Peptostreptococcaceae bacterium]